MKMEFEDKELKTAVCLSHFYTIWNRAFKHVIPAVSDLCLGVTTTVAITMIQYIPLIIIALYYRKACSAKVV